MYLIVTSNSLTLNTLYVSKFSKLEKKCKQNKKKNPGESLLDYSWVLRSVVNMTSSLYISHSYAYFLYCIHGF